MKEVPIISGFSMEVQFHILEAAIRNLEDMKHDRHDECEDCWYSCPKAENYCNETYGDVPIDERPCECGLDKRNKDLQFVIDQIGAVLKNLGWKDEHHALCREKG